MNRRGLLIAVAVAGVLGLVFAVWPQLDVALVRPFYRGSYAQWDAIAIPWLRMLRHAANWLIALVAVPAAFALLLKLLLPRRPLLMSGRSIILVLSTLALAPGVLANLVLKDYWYRPRPVFLTEFGGPGQFSPWWDPRGSCDFNCSFVAGEPAGAFWTMAPAALAPPAWRVAAYAAALTFGAAVGLLRMAGGGHFPSDVVFAGFLMFLVIWLIHGLLYRWQATRTTDEKVERIFECLTGPLYDAVTRLAAHVRGAVRRN